MPMHDLICMESIMFKYLFLLFVLVNSYATSFVPLSVKSQIVDSSAIVEGEVVSSSSYLDKSGIIITKVFLRADKWIGVKPDNNHVEVLFPGGTIGDKTFKIEGSPHFDQGEKVVLMLKSKKNKNWIMNLGMGKYKVRRYGSTNILINEIFPHHPRVGQIPLDSFYDLAKRIKKSPFLGRSKDKYEIQFEKHSQMIKRSQKVSRGIASVDRLDGKTEENRISTFWILVILAGLGAFFNFSIRSNSK